MFRKFVKPIGGLVMGWTLLGATPAEAQTTGYVSPPATGAPPTISYAEPTFAPAIGCTNTNDQCAPGVWFNMDYMIWWLSAAPSPGPLATTGSLLDPNPGAIGQPGTRVLLGDREVSNNAFSGLRIGAGTWIDEARTVGYEASGFTLEHRRNFQAVNSDGTGSPFLVRPFLDSSNNQQNGVLVALPGFQTGGVTQISSTRLCGWDFNVAFNGTDASDFRADALIGMRCLYLSESLTVQQSSQALVNQGPPGGLALQQGERLGLQDTFGTQSNFYGGQLGGRLTWISDRLITTATVKLALGVTDQIAELEGFASTRTAGTIVNSGVIVNPANQGKYFTNTFAVIPELDLNVGYRVWKNTTLRVGYSVLYWSDVVRPGNAVPNSMNPNLNPNLNPNFAPGAAGNQPRMSLSSTDFWAQGLNLGIEFRF